MFFSSPFCFPYHIRAQVSGAAALTTSGVETGEDMESYYRNQSRFEDPMANARDVD
jgi:hypothetical protein